MKKSALAYEQYRDVLVVEDISHILESIASIRIRQIKDQVIASRAFFRRLWSLYSQLRVTDKEEGMLYDNENKIDRPAVVLVTSNSGLSGEIDSQLVNTVLSQIITPNIDFFTIGLHGQRLLEQRGITPKQSFALPDISKPIDTTELVKEIGRYQEPQVYYQSFESLSTQQVMHFPLIETVRKLTSRDLDSSSEELISPDDYLFEPSLPVLVQYLESMMLSTTLTEVILESSLAQLASRFTAMNAAGARAQHIGAELFQKYSRTRRYERDELDRHYKHKAKRSF